MAYIDQHNLSQDSVFKNRVRVAMLTGATSVQSEGTTVPNHTNRANYAQLVLNSPDSYINAFCEAATTNPPIVASSPDSDLQAAVGSLWNDLAGTI